MVIGSFLQSFEKWRWLYVIAAVVAISCGAFLMHQLFGLLMRGNDRSTFSYEQIHQTYLRRDKQHPQHALLLLGDSHIHGWCEGCLGVPALNLGIGGDTAGGLNRRLRDYQMVGEPTNIAVIEIGANDVLWEGRQSLKSEFGALLRDLSALQHIFVYGVFPVAKSFSKAALNVRVTAVNIELQQLCTAAKNCSYESLQPLYNEHGYLREDLHVGDGVHLNEKAYALWTADLMAKLTRYR